MAAEEKTPPPDLADTLRDAVGPFLDFALRIWWFWLLFGAFLLVRLAVFVAHERRLARSGIRDIDLMDGSTFERYLQKLFQRQGYGVELVGSPRGDYGGDLLIQKNGTRTRVVISFLVSEGGPLSLGESLVASVMERG